MSAQTYASTADELVRRIVALIPEQPQILQMISPWGLFKVPGFNCDDLGPSLNQAAFALSMAKRQWYEQHPQGSEDL